MVIYEIQGYPDDESICDSLNQERIFATSEQAVKRARELVEADAKILRDRYDEGEVRGQCVLEIVRIHTIKITKQNVVNMMNGVRYVAKREIIQVIQPARINE